ncbi:MAG: LysR substrate-binding domain-containing protein [Solirubrobacteraceae bacterium]
MELRQLEYLVAVAEEGSFTRAAGRVHVAQPGVSAQIRRLERELGEALLDRSGPRVTLTDVGVAVLPYARAALGAVDGVREAVDELARLTRGRVRVGMVAASGAFAIADLLAGFHRAHPGVEISLLESGSSEPLLAGLADGSLDLALVGLAGTGPRRLGHQLVLEDRLAAAVAREHPLAGRARISLSELTEMPLICVPPGTGMRAALQAGCAAIGVQPTVAFEAADPVVIAQLAARGLGIAILPSSARGIDPGLHMIAIERPRMRSRVELMWRTTGTIGPATRALIQAGREFFAEPPESPSRSA